MGQVLLPNGAAQSTPPEGYTTIYAKMDGKIYYKTPAGIEVLLTDVGFYQDVVLVAAQNHGIKVDQDAPVFTWRDMEGDISARTTGGTAPTLAPSRGGAVQDLFFAVNNEAHCKYHIQHDWVMGHDSFIHLHWGHNGTAISGTLQVRLSMTYAKGHNQAVFSPEIVANITVSNLDMTASPQYGHIISEIPLSSATPSATQFNSNVFEPDGYLKVNAKVITNPTITGGTQSVPYWMGLDVHYQSTSIGTINKAPNFWGA
jgi:hypothetical protein